MLLVNCEVTFDLNWSESCVLVATNAAQATKFSTTDTKVCLPAVTLSTQDNSKVLERLKSGFKRKIDWNKHQTKVSTERVNWYLDILFILVNRLFVLPFEDEAQRRSYRRYYLPTKEIKHYNVLIDGETIFDQPIRNNLIASDNIWKISTVQGDDYKTGCVLDCNYF